MFFNVLASKASLRALKKSLTSLYISLPLGPIASQASFNSLLDLLNSGSVNSRELSIIKLLRVSTNCGLSFCHAVHFLAVLPTSLRMPSRIEAIFSVSSINSFSCGILLPTMSCSIRKVKPLSRYLRLDSFWLFKKANIPFLTLSHEGRPLKIALKSLALFAGAVRKVPLKANIALLPLAFKL